MFRSKYIRQKAQNILDMFAITDPPVDVFKIAEALGFKVIPYDFGDEPVSGILVIEDDIRAIGINKLQHLHRQRFTVAHELGHFLSGHDDFNQQSFLEHKKFYVDEGFTAHNPIEQEANSFASELLMPSKFLKRDFAAGRKDVKALSSRYLVSEQALWIQLSDLRLADDLMSSGANEFP